MRAARHALRSHSHGSGGSASPIVTGWSVVAGPNVLTSDAGVVAIIGAHREPVVIGGMTESGKMTSAPEVRLMFRRIGWCA